MVGNGLSMGKKQNKTARALESGVVLQVILRGVILCSLALIVAAGMVSYAVAKSSPRPQRVAGRESGPIVPPEPAQTPAWGELSVRDIKIEPPEEYLAFVLQHIT